MTHSVKSGTMSLEMRRGLWLRIVALLVFTLQGWHDAALLVPCMLANTGNPVASRSTADTHAAVCKCRQCGLTMGKHCCCLNAHTGAQQNAFRAVCDMPEEMTIATVFLPRLAPAWERLPVMPQVVLPPSAPPTNRSFLPSGLSPVPHELPPRCA